MKKLVFIAQPFDGQKYDQRYKDDYEPVIIAAGFEPYRVDRDPTASIPIEEIERNIDASFFVFSDISEDNPNVWFEVGYAIAKKKEVCFVCSRERIDRNRKFPFDIQHRYIIIYDSNSRSDWDKLSKAINDRIVGIVERIENNVEIEEALKDRQVSGSGATNSLSDIELAAFAIIASVTPLGSGLPEDQFAREMDRSGFTGVASNIAIRRLMAKDLIERFEERTYNGDEFFAYRPTEFGWNFLDKSDVMKLRKDPVRRARELDDEIPF